jgi:hypothetical protein
MGKTLINHVPTGAGFLPAYSDIMGYITNHFFMFVDGFNMCQLV